MIRGLYAVGVLFIAASAHSLEESLFIAGLGCIFGALAELSMKDWE